MSHVCPTCHREIDAAGFASRYLAAGPRTLSAWLSIAGADGMNRTAALRLRDQALAEGVIEDTGTGLKHNPIYRLKTP